MITSRKTYIILVFTIFIWIGFIGAISFMEAWLKFQAEGVTLKIGLSIGSLVFNALNKVELTLAIGILITLVLTKNNIKINLLKRMLLPYSILLFQSCYLLPALDKRILSIQQGFPITKSYDHLWYVILEVIKITALILIGIQILNRYEHK
ncbi:hypothetical protein [uncultured Tenacibaculum sp.]|uniref:hypothetical protein n=1 Tax=uncultured Tenacibaculum sp. TaxID=174713 RepID=UPI00260DDBD2|nr:hypothetical protein [uncultured Tenacibaculum sp.]